MNTYEAQLGLKVEGTEGTEETLTATEFRGNRKNINFRYGPNTYERGLQRGTQTKQEALKSMALITHTWEEEFVGGENNAEAPVGTTLKACGMTSVAIQKWTVTSQTGTIKAGDKVGNNASEASATKLALVTYASGTTLWLFPLLGTLATSDALTNYDRTGAATLSGSSSAGGYGYKLISEKAGVGSPTVTAEVRLGGQRHTGVGERGTFGLNMTQGQPILVTADIKGPPIFQSNSFTPREAGYVSGVLPFTSPPKVLQGVVFEMQNGASTYAPPVLTEFNISSAPTVTPRRTFTNQAIGNTGHLPTRLTGERPITGSINPEHVLPTGTFDFIGAVMAGTTFKVTCVVGAPTETNGAVTILGRRVALAGDFEPGDQDGITTAPLSLEFCGTDDDELYIFHTFS